MWYVFDLSAFATGDARNPMDPLHGNATVDFLWTLHWILDQRRRKEEGARKNKRICDISPLICGRIAERDLLESTAARHANKLTGSVK